MAHEHIVIDTDTHFTIDENTRLISIASGQTKVMQGDHRSERITFELPRLIDSHDMTLCNEVQIHYINIGSAGDQVTEDVYDVVDLKVSPENEKLVVFSWLIDGNATRFAGLLNFAIKFKCIAADGTVDYVWGTEIYREFAVGESLDNGNAVAEAYSDILAAWEARIAEIEQAGGGADWNASEGEPGHVLNRTHWVEGGRVEIFPETVLDMTAGETVLPDNIGLEAGKEYTVLWNGISYTCTAVAAEEEGMPMVVMGNLTGDPSTGEPFYMLEVPADMVEAVGFAVMVACWSSSMIPMAIYTDGEVVHKLDPKFLPDGVGESPIMVVSFKNHNLETGEIFMSHTASEIGQAIMDGKIVFMGMEGGTFTTNGMFSQDDETGDFASIGFTCITMPEMVCFVDAQGRLVLEV